MSSTADPGRQSTPQDSSRAGGDDADRTERLERPDHAERTDHRSTVAEQKERFGGIKWGSAFFGWLTATGTALILTALAAAIGAAFGLAITPGGAGQAAAEAGQAAQDPQTAQGAGLAGAIVVLVVLLVAYYAGGYVAGRMARFNGARQGVAVWVWAVVIAIVVAILAAVAGSQFEALTSLNGLPRLPIGDGAATTAAIVTAVVALAASLVGAILGGLAGMRFHRKVDRVGHDR